MRPEPRDRVGVGPRAPYPDHADLTVVIDEPSGELRPIETAADWERRRGDILFGMQAVMGRLPSTDELGPLEVEQRGCEPLDGCTRLLVTYTAGPVQAATAHLYLPAAGVGDHLVGADGRRPAVLALHPTSALGKLVVAGDGPGPTPSSSRAAATSSSRPTTRRSVSWPTTSSTSTTMPPARWRRS